MSKSVSAGFLAHLSGYDTSKIALLFKATRLDGVIFGFSTFDRDLTVGITTFEADSAIIESAVQTSADLSVDNVDVDGVFDSEHLTEVDLRAGRWDFCAVEMFIVNWSDLTQGSIQLRKGRLGQLTAGRYRFTAELRGLMQHLQQDIGRVYSPFDDVDLGDARNGLNIVAWTETGSVSTVTDARQFTTSLTRPTGWFDGGKITFTNGLNDDLSMEVKTYLNSGGSLALQLPMPFVVAPGNTFSIYAGYDKTLQQSASKFNNIINNRSFPWVPGKDIMITGGR